MSESMSRLSGTCPEREVIVNSLSSPSKLKRIAASKKWVLTWNNYPEDWLSRLSSHMDKAAWICGLEVGDSGTPHVQGYVEFDKAVRPIEYCGDSCRGIHWEKARGTRAANIAYCSKDGTYHGTLRPKRQLTFPPMERPWQKSILKLIEGTPDDRTIYWYWSEAGNVGKSTFTKYLIVHHEAILLQGKGADVRNGVLTYLQKSGEYPELCVFNIPRSYNAEYLSYEALENVKDMCFYSGKYEGGTVCGPCPHLIVFSNQEPDYNKLSPDRWSVTQIDGPR